MFAPGGTPPNRLQKPLSRWLARPRKRHYTFARRLSDRFARGSGFDTAPSLPQSVDLPEVCDQSEMAMPRPDGRGGTALRSLRLSVRTPPFHGGESGSIPLGSAKTSQK
jgi:hypothetical protein